MRIRLLTVSLALGIGAGCAGDGAAPTAAVDAASDAAAVEVAPDLGVHADRTGSEVIARPMLDTVMLRPGDKDHTLHHLDCAMNAAGEAVAVWRQTGPDNDHQVWTTRLGRDQAAWSPLQSLGVRPATEVDRVSAAIDRDGRALAVWNEPDGPAAGVVSARFTPAGGWEAPKRVGPGWILSLASSPTGEASAFSLLDGTPPTLVRFVPATGWQIDGAFASARAGFFFAGPAGGGVLFWNQPATPPSHELHAAEYTPGGVWSPGVRLHEARPFDHPFPLVNAALAGDGSGLAVWNRGGEKEGELWASVRAPGGGWQAPALLKAGEAPLWTTTVLVKDGGDGLVAWETGMPPRRKIWLALRAGGVWQPAAMLGDSSELVTAALGPDGSAILAFATPRRVYARRYTPGRGWGDFLEATGANGGVADLCAAIDGQGRGWVLWINGGPQMLRAAAVAE